MEPLQSGQSYSIEKNVLALLPDFVAAKIQEVALKKGYTTFTYHEQAGSIDGRESSKQIAFWMHSSGRARHWIYLAGA